MRINNKKQLPKEFSLSKYDSLCEMSDKDLFRQLYWRSDDLNVISKECSTYGLEFGASYPVNDNFGDPFKINNNIKERSQRNNSDSKLRLSYGDGIRPISRFDLASLTDEKSISGVFEGKDILISYSDAGKLLEDNSDLFWNAMLEPISLLSGAYKGMVLASIDLNDPDELLLDDFNSLIKEWRKELKIKEPDLLSGKWEFIRKRILDYKIIPLIDLMSWAKSNNYSITYEVYAVSLFPDGEKGSLAIPQTILPFLEKILSINSLEKYKREIMSNNLI
ncbi:DUF6387 family protein [Morganella psychrotolerans]|uniref:Uncharacterized protein n=1 Tax=Morganella psychrotolerans TaxID=368603 RepID=A0A1B8HNG5_9GAMM|nr:DUF6387 family protein [Morganella psychrotolerans]OBU11015.1 hypothetical protein AYY18_03510 [Morganella psychrotolerans]